jgi:hypothetical protein
MLFQVVVDQKMSIQILFTISSKSLTTRQKSLRERERDKETKRERERESLRERVQEGTTFSCPRPKLKTEKNLILALTLDSGVLVYGKHFPCQLFFSRAVLGAVRVRECLKYPIAFFFGQEVGRWGMGSGIYMGVNDLIASFFFRVKSKGD